ncbi:MAG: PIG-L family deacetylase [Chitinophagaceae bacterium]|nr:PIG-L family deacetylase [Chitinophagaceae bacterium]
MPFRLVILFLFILSAVSSYSQPDAPYSSSEIFSALRKLNVLGSVLYVAAHPDDENTRLLAYLSKEKMYRTGYLSLTRGDGGQNLVGDEQGIELGLIRTQELLAARRIDGAEQFFTRAFDFGYSKNPEETLHKWGRDNILSDMVWVIRKFQPDVIITRFPETGEGGHGHHTASAILAKEAFKAAADPKRFSSQLKWVNTWQPSRLLWNTYRFGNTNTISEDQFKIDVGDFNPLLGKSYGEISAESRSQHKSQGFGVPAGRGEAFEYFSVTLGSEPEKELFDDINTGWDQIEGGGQISKIIDSLVENYDLVYPNKSVKGLTRLYTLMKSLPEGYWKEQKMKEVKELIVTCSGLWMDAYTDRPVAVQTDSLRFNLVLNDRAGVDAKIQKYFIENFDTVLNYTLQKNKNLILSHKLYVPPEKKITQPFWLQMDKAEGYYNITDQELIGRPDAIPAYTVHVQLQIEGADFFWPLPIRYRYTDPVDGELYEPLVVIPPVTVLTDEKIKITSNTNQFSGLLKMNAHTKNVHVTITDAGIRFPGNPHQQFTPAEISFRDDLQSREIAYVVNAKKDNEYFFMAEYGRTKEKVGLKEWKKISYDHIPPINYFSDAKIINRNLDLHLAGKHIGYIPGAGDKVSESLVQMGYEVTILNEKELALNDLRKFDAIITGIRAYNTNEWLNQYYNRLMKYIEDGGNLIVQYNTSSNLGPVKARIGPYPFNISRERITDETSTIDFLKPMHRALNFPNKITQKDFEGWIQERSIYHAGDLDKNYETIIAMNDPGETSQNGSLVIARYGKGNFVYTGLVFFRQLPAGVPGAYRLLANLIALSKE